MLIVTPNSFEATKKIISQKYYDFNLASDPGLNISKSFGINSWNSANEPSHVYIVDKDNKIIYAEHEYKGQGEKLMVIQSKLFEAFKIEPEFVISKENYKPLFTGDTAPDFEFSYYDETGIVTKNFLSKYKGEKKVVIAFYPAPFSYSCAMEVRTFESYVDQTLPNKIKNSNLGDDFEIFMVSVSNFGILSSWKNELGLKNVKLVNDGNGSISKLYNSYNSMGWNARTIFVVDKDGKLSYIDWDYDVEKDFDLLKEQLAAN